MPIDPMYTTFNYPVTVDTYTTYATNDVTIKPERDYLTYDRTNNNLLWNYDIGTNTVKVKERYITQETLDNFAHRIYKIIKENTRIDISEDEFMNLLKEGED